MSLEAAIKATDKVTSYQAQEGHENRLSSRAAYLQRWPSQGKRHTHEKPVSTCQCSSRARSSGHGYLERGQGGHGEKSGLFFQGGILFQVQITGPAMRASMAGMAAMAKLT